MEELSANTQAILLLTAPLMLSRSAPADPVLTQAEYKKLATFLLQKGFQPADFLNSNADSVLSECSALFDPERLKKLLARGFQLGSAIENWSAMGIWVVSRADKNYPKKFKRLLKGDAPAVLYGCGPLDLCGNNGFAVVGSRDINEDLAAYAAKIGRLTAEAGITLVSGGAKGTDQAAMQGALDAGGAVCGVLSSGLENAVLSSSNRSYLKEGRLLLISPFDPKAEFNVAHAMQRNKLIYALAEASLVVNSAFEKGGTWTGAVEQLRKFNSKPLFIRSTAQPSKGLTELQKKGALPWPEPKDPESFLKVLEAVSGKEPTEPDLFS